MKTKFIILVASAIAFCSFQNSFAHNSFEKQDTTLTRDTTKIIYTCPMHSEIISGKREKTIRANATSDGYDDESDARNCRYEP